MLLRRYHAVKEEAPNGFIEDVEKAIKKYGEEVVFDYKTPILEELTVKELKEMALDKDIEVPKKIKKDDLIKLIREG